MTEGRIDWLGADGKYRSEDTGSVGDPGDLVLAEDRDGNTILLEWDATAAEWQFGGSVNINEHDVTGVDTLDATLLSADGVLKNAIYPTPNDIPEAYEQEGAQVYTQSEGLVVFEGGD